MLYGPSGVGKSSLLHAGVVHHLRAAAEEHYAKEDEGEPRTGVVILDDWTGDPAERLTGLIQRLTANDGAESVTEAVAAYRRRHGGGLLVILDQFEDYVRLHPDPHGRRLDAILPALVGDGRSGARILIAIRADRLADLDRFSGRVPNLLGNVFRLGPLTPAAALAAIEGPIERYASWARTGRVARPVALEPGLAVRVRDELVSLSERRQPDEAGAANDGGSEGRGVEASYLQLVMRRLWDEEVAAAGGATLRLATLTRLGGAEEIVATHLDSALASLSRHEQAVADEVLRFLVTPSGATACLTAGDLSEYTSRPAAEVEALAEKLSRPPTRILRGVAAPSGQVTAAGYELPRILAEPALEWRTRRRTERLERRARSLLLGLVAMTAVAIALVSYALDPTPLQRLELATVDWRFDIRGPRPPDPRIALVTVDEAANARLQAGPEPPRAVTARVLDVIATTRPRAVAVDIRYEKAKDPRSDNLLIGAIRGPLHARLVLATGQLNSEGMAELFQRTTETYGDSPYKGKPAVGYAGFPADPGGVARRIERSVALPVPGASGLDTLGVVAAGLGGGIRANQLPAAAWIDYHGGPGTFKPIGFYDVLGRRPEALAQLRGKIVVLGNTARAGNDVHRTSAPGSGAMDGAEIQANAISTALDRFPLRDAGRGVDIALIIGLGLMPLAAAIRLRRALIVPAGLLAAALFCAAAQLAFASGRVVTVVYPLIALALTTIGWSTVVLLRGSPATRA